MTRREFIAIAGGVAAVWPFASSAQQVPVIGFLGSSSSAAQVGQTAFRQGLKGTRLTVRDTERANAGCTSWVLARQPTRYATDHTANFALIRILVPPAYQSAVLMLRLNVVTSQFWKLLKFNDLVGEGSVL
jgi:hypothetical protein